MPRSATAAAIPRDSPRFMSQSVNGWKTIASTMAITIGTATERV